VDEGSVLLDGAVHEVEPGAIVIITTELDPDADVERSGRLNFETGSCFGWWTLRKNRIHGEPLVDGDTSAHERSLDSLKWRRHSKRL